jgi:hypothetical protein
MSSARDAVTGLENEEEGMDDWWTRNEEHFMKCGMYPNGVACLTATRGRRRRSGGGYTFDKEYEESQEKIRRAVSRVYLRAPWQPVPALEWFKMIVEVSFPSGKHVHSEVMGQSREVLSSAFEELVRRCEMTRERKQLNSSVN